MVTRRELLTCLSVTAGEVGHPITFVWGTERLSEDWPGLVGQALPEEP